MKHTNNTILIKRCYDMTSKNIINAFVFNARVIFIRKFPLFTWQLLD